jgi:hypothetical protein
MSLDAYPAKTFWVHHCDGGEAMRSVGEGNRKKEWCWILIKRVEKSSVFDGGGMLEFVVDTFLLKKNQHMPNYLIMILMSPYHSITTVLALKSNEIHKHTTRRSCYNKALTCGAN